MKLAQNAVVIGTGMMGPGIAATLALGGVRTTIVSRGLESAIAAAARARGQMDLLVSAGLRTGEARAEITASADLDAAVAGTDLVIESAPEDMELKQALFARMDAIAPAGAILASNTSGLSISAIASRCARPERVLTAHFWNPPHLMPLVEIVKGEKTDPALAEALAALLSRCGKTVVILQKDRPGQLGNRLQMALLREACAIVEEGIASVEDVDRAAKTGFGLRLPVYGIFEHQDAVGLDMGLGILEYIAADLYSQPRAPEIYRQKVRDGKLGAKCGEGFYQWSERGSLDELKRRRDAFVLDFLKRG